MQLVQFYLLGAGIPTVISNLFAVLFSTETGSKIVLGSQNSVKVDYLHHLLTLVLKISSSNNQIRIGYWRNMRKLEFLFFVPSPDSILTFIMLLCCTMNLFCDSSWLQGNILLQFAKINCSQLGPQHVVGMMCNQQYFGHPSSQGRK